MNNTKFILHLINGKIIYFSVYDEKQISSLLDYFKSLDTDDCFEQDCENDVHICVPARNIVFVEVTELSFDY